MDKEKLPKALQEMVAAIEAAGGSIKSISSVPVLAEDETGGETDGEADAGETLITRKMIQHGIAEFNLAVADNDASFDESFGDNQNLYSRRSTATIMALVLRDPKTLAHIMDSYRTEAANEPGLVDMPTPEELAAFQLWQSVGQVGYAMEVGLFAGAILGRGGFTNQEVLRLMNEPAFTFKLLTLRYRPEEVCNLGRETLERLDEMMLGKN